MSLQLNLEFGPNESYFFESPQFMNWSSNVPQEFSQQLLGGSSKVLKPFCVALGEGGTFYLSWKGIDGNIWGFSCFRGRYPALKDWLTDVNYQHEHHKTVVSLGPNDRFFAYSNAGYRWGNVPAEFEKDIQACLDFSGWRYRPEMVTFGVEDSYLIICEGSRYWAFDKLQENYPGLFELIKHKIDCQIAVKAVTLNPYAPDQYFIVFSDGSVNWKVPTAWAGLLNDASRQYNSSNSQYTATITTTNIVAESRASPLPPIPSTAGSPPILTETSTASPVPTGSMYPVAVTSVPTTANSINSPTAVPATPAQVSPVLQPGGPATSTTVHHSQTRKPINWEQRLKVVNQGVALASNLMKLGNS